MQYKYDLNYLRAKNLSSCNDPPSTFSTIIKRLSQQNLKATLVKGEAYSEEVNIVTSSNIVLF